MIIVLVVVLGINKIHWLSYMAAVKGNGLILFHCCIQQWNKTKQMNTHTHIHTDVVQNDCNDCPRLSRLYYIMASTKTVELGKL